MGFYGREASSNFEKIKSYLTKLKCQWPIEQSHGISRKGIGLRSKVEVDALEPFEAVVLSNIGKGVGTKEDTVTRVDGSTAVNA